MSAPLLFLIAIWGLWIHFFLRKLTLCLVVRVLTLGISWKNGPIAPSGSFSGTSGLSWLASRYWYLAIRCRASHRSLRFFYCIFEHSNWFNILHLLVQFVPIFNNSYSKWVFSYVQIWQLSLQISADSLVLASCLSPTLANKISGLTLSIPCIILNVWRISCLSLLVCKLSNPTSLHHSLNSLLCRPDTKEL